MCYVSATGTSEWHDRALRSTSCLYLCSLPFCDYILQQVCYGVRQMGGSQVSLLFPAEVTSEQPLALNSQAGK